MPTRPTDAPWELYNLASDFSESKDLADFSPDMVARLAALAAEAHQPAVEGIFTSTVRHERDRRAKFGQQDDPVTPGPGGKAKARTRKAAASLAR